MTKRDVAALGVKLIGVFLLASRIGSLHILIRNLSNAARSGVALAGAWATLIGSLTSFLLTVAAYVWMILRGDVLAAAMVDQDSEPELGNTISRRDLQIVAFSSIGLIVLLQTLPRCTELVLSYLAYVTPIPRPLRQPTPLPTQMLTVLAQLTAGLYTFLGAPGLVELVERYTPRSQQNATEQEDRRSLYGND